VSAVLLAQAAGDPGGLPFLKDGVDWGDVAVVLVKLAVAFFVLLTAVAMMIWFERKLIGRMQNRIGPNRAGPFGLLQTLADGLKLFTKEDLLPARADRFVFRLAPFLSAVPAFLVFTVIPVGGQFFDGKQGEITIFGKTTYLQFADPPVGFLLVLAMSSLAVYGVMLAGWASGSKYPLLGSVRASAQMISYEAALGLSVATVFLVSGTLSTHGIVVTQDRILDWNIVATGFLPFVIFVIAATAELNRPPFDLVEAEQELVGGFHTEYSAVGFMLFYLAEFMNTVTMSAIIVTLFLGGPSPIVPVDLPILPGWFEGVLWFFLKLFVFLFMYVWIRATLPRLRYDQLMDLGWKLLIPVAFAWFLVIALLRIGRNNDWQTGNWVAAAASTLAVFVLGYLLFAAATRTAGENRRAGRSMF
jgi:NADH-quinone oxidoreductase subunit H